MLREPIFAERTPRWYSEWQFRGLRRHQAIAVLAAGVACVAWVCITALSHMGQALLK